MFKDDVRKYFKVTLAPELKQTNKEKKWCEGQSKCIFYRRKPGWSRCGVSFEARSRVQGLCLLTLWSWDSGITFLRGLAKMEISLTVA